MYKSVFDAGEELHGPDNEAGFNVLCLYTKECKAGRYPPTMKGIC
jgi:hypothetical protein